MTPIDSKFSRHAVRRDSRRRSTTHAALAAALAAGALALAACTATGGLDDTRGGAVDAVESGPRSPAAERVIGGIVEMVLTRQPWPTFDEARDNRITEVTDGSPVYAYLRSTRPLGQLAHPADPGGTYAFSEYPHLFFQVGDNESLTILSTCYVTLTEDEAKQHELVVPLAPLTYRPGQIPADCWLSAAASAKPGNRTFEIRLAGFPGRFESWLPVPDLLSIAPLRAGFDSGAGEYATMLRATPLRNATILASVAPAGSAGATLGSLGPSDSVASVSTVSPGSVLVAPIRGSTLIPASPLLPGPRQNIASTRMDLQLQTLSAAVLGRRPSEAYFTDPQWTGVSDARGRTSAQQAQAAAVFKGDTCSWQRLRVTRRPNAPTLSDVEAAGDPIQVNCSDLP